MTNITRIHQGKTPRRLHYIAEWMERRGKSGADLMREIGCDKSLVSRWINDGSIPSDKWIDTLAAALETTPEGLFRHPDDDWLSRWFKAHSEEERQRAIQLLKTAFPDRQAG